MSLKKSFLHLSFSTPLFWMRLGVVCLMGCVLAGSVISAPQNKWDRQDAKCDLNQYLLQFAEQISKKGYTKKIFEKCKWGDTLEEAADKIYTAFLTQSVKPTIKSRFCGLFKNSSHLSGMFSEEQNSRIALKCGLIK